MALIVAGERSGVGKTTVTLALLSCLRQRNVQVQSFKVGPDYIDPMFHRYVTGRACRNLDPVLTSEAYVQQCFDRHAQTATHTLVEGVMGLFDGAAGRKDFASTAHIARLLDIPVLLVLNCSGMSHSIAAIAHGYRSLDPRLKFAGVVLNRVGSDRHLELLTAALEPLDIPILGVLRRQDEITIPDRHLGLIPTAELENLNAIVGRLAHLGATCFDWTRLMPLLAQEAEGRGQASQSVVRLSAHAEVSRREAEGRRQESGVRRQESGVKVIGSTGTAGVDYFRGSQESGIGTQNSKLSSAAVQRATQNSKLSPSPRIAIAQDSAFSFYYADNLDLLEALGAELISWSPLSDRALPDDVQGLYFGGGFPEVFAETLAANTSARYSVQSAIQAGMPTYAECGGLMYLCETITTFEGQSFPMVGVLPTTAVMGKRLTLGYRRAIACQDSLMLTNGAIVWGHEFHRSYLEIGAKTPLFDMDSQKPDSPVPVTKTAFKLPDSQSPGHPMAAKLSMGQEGWHRPNLHASYLHLHWGTYPESPARFLNRAARYSSYAG